MPDEEIPMTEIAPGVTVFGKVKRVLYAEDPKEADYLAAAETIHDVRMKLAEQRRRLKELYRTVDIGHIASDGITGNAAGALTCVIHTLYELEVGEHSFKARAELARALWDDVEAHPDHYVIEPGKHDSWAYNREAHMERRRAE